MVIINLRQLSKQNTKKIILNETALLLGKVGFLNLSSKDIAHASGVSQGTIFLHFKTKERLLNSVILDQIKFIETAVFSKCKIEATQHSFIKNFIDTYIESENILSRLQIDLYYLPESVKKQISIYEGNLKNLFFDNLKYNSKSKINIIDTYIGIESFLSQIQRNLIEKDFKNSMPVLKQKRGRLLKLYKILFG